MKKILLFIFAAMMCPNCIFAQRGTAYDREAIRCLGVELDGSQTLRVRGYGRNIFDAKEQAAKNAVWAVIFNGIKDGSKGCNMRPLVAEANANEKYEDYFNTFFTDKGDYSKYISFKDTKRFSRGKSRDKVGTSYDITIRVLRPQLRERLKTDNIIKD